MSDITWLLSNYIKHYETCPVVVANLDSGLKRLDAVEELGG